MLFAFKLLRSDTGLVTLICCASKGNLQSEFTCSLNQQILQNIGGNLSNDDCSQIKTRVFCSRQ